MSLPTETFGHNVKHSRYDYLSANNVMWNILEYELLRLNPLW